MAGVEVAANLRLGQLAGQPGPIRQEPGSEAARMGHHAGTITGHGRACRPRSALHLPSAFLLGLLEPSQVQLPPAQQALRCFYSPITPPRRERSGLGMLSLAPVGRPVRRNAEVLATPRAAGALPCGSAGPSRAATSRVGFNLGGVIESPREPAANPLVLDGGVAHGELEIVEVTRINPSKSTGVDVAVDVAIVCGEAQIRATLDRGPSESPAAAKAPTHVAIVSGVPGLLPPTPDGIGGSTRIAIGETRSAIRLILYRDTEPKTSQGASLWAPIALRSSSAESRTRSGCLSSSAIRDPLPTRGH